MPLVPSDKPRKRGTICGRGKWYSPLTNQVYSFQSSYERELMNYLDNHNIKWVKNKERFPYLLEEKQHNYIPDFYLPDFDLYIETKGMIRKSDPVKFEAFPKEKNLALLTCDDMQKLGCRVFDPRNAPVDPNKWPLTVLSKLSEWQEPGELSSELAERVSSKKFFMILEGSNDE